MFKKILVTIFLIITVPSLVACGDGVTNDYEIFSVDEINFYTNKTEKICNMYNYDFELSKKGNSALVYEISSNKSGGVEVAFLKWSKDDVDLNFSIVNNNLLESECVKKLEEKYDFAIDYLNEFVSLDISKGDINAFIADESNIQGLSGDDEVLFSKQYNDNYISMTYQLFCENGQPSKEYKSGDLLREVLLFSVNLK